VGQNFRVSGKFPISRRKLSRMGRGIHVVTWSHLILLRITKIAEGWSHTLFRFPICSVSCGVKCWYSDHLDATVGLLGFFHSSSRTRFTSSLATATLEDGMTLDSGPWGLGNVDVHWRYLSRAIYRHFIII